MSGANLSIVTLLCSRSFCGEIALEGDAVNVRQHSKT